MSKFIEKYGFDSSLSALFALCLPLLFLGFEPIKWICLFVVVWFLFFVALGQLLLFFNDIFDILDVNIGISNISYGLFNIAHIPIIIWCFIGMCILRLFKK